MRVLVTVASKHDATAEIADELGRVLVDRDHDVVVEQAGPELDAAGFDAVVIGSAVYTGKWLPEAGRFVDRNLDTLRTKPVWLFSSGPVGDPPIPDEEPTEATELVARLGAEGHRLFGGRLDRDHLGLGERILTRAVRAPEGDYRDWEEIRSWAVEIADTLGSR